MTSLLSIERLLTLQKGAYELLLWLSKRARDDDSILSDDNLQAWRFADSSQTWLRDFSGMMPAALRPDENDWPAFARLFSSFFSTSFHLSETTNVPDRYGSGYYEQHKRRSLVAGAPSVGKRSAKNKEKIKDNARELERIALEALALENELFPPRAALDALLNSTQLKADLLIWTWFHELERRAQFASQGAPVHLLWRDLDKDERENLNAARVWATHENLLAMLRRQEEPRRGNRL